MIELLVLVNKSFGWLIELGYIKWKCLDFNVNLDKIFSEICVVFDDVFFVYVDEKEIYYLFRV